MHLTLREQKLIILTYEKSSPLAPSTFSEHIKKNRMKSAARMYPSEGMTCVDMRRQAAMQSYQEVQVRPRRSASETTQLVVTKKPMQSCFDTHWYRRVQWKTYVFMERASTVSSLTYHAFV